MTAGPLISVDELRAAARRASPCSTCATGWAGRRAGRVRAPVTSRGRRTSTWTPTSPSAPGAGGRHPLPETAVFEAAMRRAGVSDGRPVVVYDDWEGRAAARAWWLLRFHGHPDVRVLDGGWSAWLAAGGGRRDRRRRLREPGDFTAQPGGMPVVEADGVLDVGRAGRRPGGGAVPRRGRADRPGRRPHPRRGQRADHRERGRGRPVPVGRGAAGRRTRPSARPPARDVAAYCGSGVTAAHDVLAMEVAGVTAALYPGSWSGWITDPDRPVERG